MDAEAILYHQPKLCVNIKEWKEIKATQAPEHNDYKKCTEILKAGITVIKYNFCNMGSRSITLRLSNNEKFLHYKDNRMKIEKTLTVSTLKGLLYGGTTKTFKAHRKRILKKYEAVEDSTPSRLPHFDRKRSLLSSEINRSKSCDSKLL